MRNINLTVRVLRHIHKRHSYDGLNNTLNKLITRETINRVKIAREFKIFSVMKFRSLSPLLSSLSNGNWIASLQTTSKRSLGKFDSKMVQNPNNIA